MKADCDNGLMRSSCRNASSRDSRGQVSLGIESDDLMNLDMSFAMDKEGDCSVAYVILEECLPLFLKYNVQILRSLSGNNKPETLLCISHMQSAAEQFGAKELSIAAYRLYDLVEASSSHLQVDEEAVTTFEYQFTKFLDTAWSCIQKFHLRRMLNATKRDAK